MPGHRRPELESEAPKFPLYHILEKKSSKNRIVIFTKFFPEITKFLWKIHKIVKNFTIWRHFVAFCYQIVTILLFFCHFSGNFWKIVKNLSICNHFVTICNYFVTFSRVKALVMGRNDPSQPHMRSIWGQKWAPYSLIRARVVKQHICAHFFNKSRCANLTFLKKYVIILKKTIFFRAIKKNF